MRRGFRFVLLWTVVLSALTMGGTVVGEQTPSCTITVQPGESIQAAIDSTPAGGVICLADGRWEENLTIDKSLTLVGCGSDRSSVVGRKRGVPVLRVDSAVPISVTVANLGVLDARGGPQECVSVYPQQAQTICPDGVAIMGYAAVILRGVRGTGCGRMGVYATDYSSATLRDCFISGSGRIGLFVRRYAAGTAENTYITANNEGAMVADSAFMTLQSCEITNSASYGLYVGGQPICELRSCKIARNGNNGIALADKPHLTLISTSVTENLGWGILRLTYPVPYQAVLSIDTSSDLAGNQLGEIGTR